MRSDRELEDRAEASHIEYLRAELAASREADRAVVVAMEAAKATIASLTERAEAAERDARAARAQLAVAEGIIEMARVAVEFQLWSRALDILDGKERG